MSLITPDFGLLVWMTLIFGIVFFVLAKWGFPLITGMVDKRSDRINQSIAQAREAEKMLSELGDRQERLIEEESALRDIRTEVAGLSVDVAEKILREKLSTDEAQLALIDKMIGEASASKPN